jgi:metal-responsive CopG/Arc/MetJ family transcriptional regulator
MVGFRSPIDLAEALDRAAQDYGVARSKMIRDIVEDWLRAKGYLPK